MSGDAHRVRRLLWRIKLGSPEEAFALRARLTRTVRTEILPEIERVFADLPSGDDLIQIERLSGQYLSAEQRPQTRDHI